MKVPPKQTMYKIAYSPLFNCYVVITHAYQDMNYKVPDTGNWVFVCYNHQVGLKDHLFREHELIEFCL
jgi:hypothetical protein